MATSSNHFAPVIIIGMLLWSVYRRIRRNFGRQPLRKVREGVLVTVFGVLAVIMTIVALVQSTVPAYVGGAVAGMLLGLVGLRLARIEITPTGNFYLPNKYLGTGITLLVTTRIAYRIYVVSVTPEAMPQAATPVQNALTIFLFGVLAFYYIVFFAGLLFRCQKLANDTSAPPPPPPPSPKITQ